jgi:hypothetical protein
MVKKVNTNNDSNMEGDSSSKGKKIIKTVTNKRNRNSKPSRKRKKNRNSRPSQKKKQNRNSKQSKVEKNNRYTKPSAKLRAKRGVVSVNIETVALTTQSDWSTFYSTAEEQFEASEIYEFLNGRFFSNNQILFLSKRNVFLDICHQFFSLGICVVAVRYCIRIVN